MNKTVLKKYIYIIFTFLIVNYLFISLSEAASGLELKGTVFTRSLKPIAIIKDTKTGKVNMYEAGENICKIKILEVKRAEVILQEGKAKYVLALPRGSVRQPYIIDFDISKEDTAFRMSRADVNKAISRIPRLMRDIKIIPHFAKGKPQGMRLSKVKEGSIFQKAGVKSGDVVKGVNGMTLNTPHQIFRAYRELKNQNSFQVEIVRDGEPAVLNYRLD